MGTVDRVWALCISGCRRCQLLLAWAAQSSHSGLQLLTHNPALPRLAPNHPVQLKQSTRQAGVSTASMGKFDRMVEGEKAEDRRAPAAKRRKFMPVADKVPQCCLPVASLMAV